jgi:hypothetical protein
VWEADLTSVDETSDNSFRRHAGREAMGSSKLVSRWAIRSGRCRTTNCSGGLAGAAQSGGGSGASSGAGGRGLYELEFISEKENMARYSWFVCTVQPGVELPCRCFLYAQKKRNKPRLIKKGQVI